MIVYGIITDGGQITRDQQPKPFTVKDLNDQQAVNGEIKRRGSFQLGYWRLYASEEAARAAVRHAMEN